MTSKAERDRRIVESTQLVRPPPCIYCNERPADSLEHLLPAALGTFPGFIPRRGVLCSDCNHRLGRDLIQPTFRRGAYSVLRRMIPWDVGRGESRNRSRGLSHEAPIYVRGDLRAAIHVELDQGGMNLRFLNQVIFRKADGSEESWIVPRDVGSEAQLREALTRRDRLPPCRVTALLSDDPQLASWVQTIYHRSIERVLPATPPGSLVGYEVRTEIDDRMRRAIAMLGLHFLIATGSHVGRGAPFDAVRRFIATGASSLPIVWADAEWPSAFPSAAFSDRLPDRIKHVFLTQVSPAGDLFAAVRLFAAAQHTTPWWSIRLAVGVSPTWSTSGCALVYFSARPGERFDGETLLLTWERRTVAIGAPLDLSSTADT
jgi:hypothetical protein